MIVCKDCGNQEADSTSFCGACGSFLEWHGEQLTEAPGDPGFDIENAEELRGRGVVATVKEVLGLDHEEQARLAEEAARNQEAAAERQAAYDAADTADALGESRTAAEMEARAAAGAEERARTRQEVASESQARAAQAAAQAAEAQARATEQAQAEVSAKLEAARRAAEAEDEETRLIAEAQARSAEIAAAQASARAKAEAEARADAELRSKAEAEAAERAAAAAEKEAEARRNAQARAAAAAEEEAKARAESEERLKRAAALVAPKAPAPKPARRAPAPRQAQPTGPGPGPAGAAGAASSASASLPGPEVTATGGDIPAGGFSPADASSGAAVVGITGTGNPQPDAVLPGMAQRRPRAVRSAPAQRRPEPGDLICGQCGTFNEAQRKFCRHCGTSLAEAATVNVSWWRRLVAWFRGRRERRRARALGSRPKVSSGPAGDGRLRRWTLTWSRWTKRVLVLAIAAIAILAVVPGTNPIKTERQKLFGEVKGSKAITLYPSSAVATSQVAGHTATDAINYTSNIAWYSAPSAAGGVGQAITATFPAPTEIDRIGFISGAYQAAFQVESRPFGVKIIFMNAAGKTLTTTEHQLADSASFQPITVKVTNVSKVEVQILSVYRGAGDNGVALASLQFFRIQKA